VDWGGHVHQTFARGVPEIDANPVSFYGGGGKVWSLTRQSVPYVNFKVAVLEFTYKRRWLWIV